MQTSLHLAAAHAGAAHVSDLRYAFDSWSPAAVIIAAVILVTAIAGLCMPWYAK